MNINLYNWSKKQEKWKKNLNAYDYLELKRYVILLLFDNKGSFSNIILYNWSKKREKWKKKNSSASDYLVPKRCVIKLLFDKKVINFYKTCNFCKILYYQDALNKNRCTSFDCRQIPEFLIHSIGNLT